MKNHFTLSLIFLFTIISNTYSQSDYGNTEQFRHFRNRRLLISNWQINQLADSGALIVRLKSNKKAIDLLKRENKLTAAKEIEKQTYQLNKLIVRAFYKHYNFSKLYFIYDYSSDSLLKGYKKGFFLDTNLNRNTDIEMKEKFYLIAEKDKIVQSSIGFVPEHEASKVSETGAPVKDVAIVIKNKYGHQLKSPFPYYIKGQNVLKYEMYVQKLVNNFTKFKEKNPRKSYSDDIKPFLY
ncbi:MAG: hypothetical protein N2203_03310 [Bacteroidia bacterium]|nr:hypothetical protein [Bacteroidia bacterium]